MSSQTEKDTAAAKAKQNNSNQAAKDTARAKSRQNGGDGGTSNDFAARESANGLSNTTSGFGGSAPSFAQREAANGLSNTTSGRSDTFYQFSNNLPSTDEPMDHGIHDQTDDRLPLSQGAFAAIICVNGEPHYASIQGIIGDAIT